MIKRNRNPIFYHLWRSEQYSAFPISQSESNFHYQHIIRVPARLFALKSCSCCCCPLPFKLRLFRDPFFAKCFTLKTAVIFGKRPVCIPRYHVAKLSFSRVLFCQNIMLPKHCDAKCPNLVLQNFSCQQFFTHGLVALN